jgi:hypothetical protein
MPQKLSEGVVLCVACLQRTPKTNLLVMRLETNKQQQQQQQQQQQPNHHITNKTSPSVSLSLCSPSLATA